MNYCITWKYIVEKMETKFGIPQDSTEELSFGEIKRYVSKIWDEYFDELHELERSNKGGEKNGYYGNQG